MCIRCFDCGKLLDKFGECLFKCTDCNLTYSFSSTQKSKMNKGGNLYESDADVGNGDTARTPEVF
jgi:hypothetical protein